MAKRVGGEVSYDKNEILDVKWISIQELEAMTEKELRGFKSILDSIYRVRNDFLTLDVSREIWDKKVLELIVFLHDEVFKNK